MDMFTKYPLDKDFEVSGILISLEFCWVNFPFDGWRCIFI